jgi:hypothetical protein
MYIIMYVRGLSANKGEGIILIGARLFHLHVVLMSIVSVNALLNNPALVCRQSSQMYM